MHLKIAMLGYGNVARALARLLLRKTETLQRDYDLTFSITGIATRSRGSAINPQGLDITEALRVVDSGDKLDMLHQGPPLADTFAFIEACPADLIMEATWLNPQTGQPATDYVRAALQAGRHVVTANKGPVAFAYRELKELARAELDENQAKVEELGRQLSVLLLPKDENDERSVIMEIRGGTGGDEAALFAYNLYRMYTMYAERKGWKTEILSVNETELGGMKEVSFSVEGDGVYSRLKFEAGTHRVQRVPETEAQGRIHTSAVTVAVMPQAEDVDVELAPDATGWSAGREVDHDHDWVVQLAASDGAWRLQGRLPRGQRAVRLAPSLAP